MPLSKERILSNYSGKKATLHVFDQIDSTNEFLKNSNIPFEICTAEQQLKGKGQHGKTWHSPHGINIYLSYKYTFDIKHYLQGLSLVAGIALRKTIAKVLDVNNIDSSRLKIKWPNDIYYNNQKLAGILVETQFSKTSDNRPQSIAIIGMGININMQEDRESHVNQPWTSLQQITNTHHDRNSIIANLIKNLEQYLEQFEHEIKHNPSEQLKYFTPEWNIHDYLSKKTITIDAQNKTHIGIVIGISPQGFLILRNADDELTISSGKIIKID